MLDHDELVKKPTRILVVDDELNITELISMALKLDGFEIQTAATARAARQAIVDSAPDLVILDVGLPDEDGFSLVERLSRDGHRVPVIFLTARDATEEKIRGLTIGGEEHAPQPLSPQKLGGGGRGVLRRHSGAPRTHPQRVA